MLVLTRKLMEKIQIGDEICVTVVRIEGGQVRLGIDAPRSVSIVRDELRSGPKSTIRPRSDPANDRRPDPPLRASPSAPPGTDSRPRAPSR